MGTTATPNVHDLPPTFSLQCLHTVVSPAPSMARQPRHVSRFCANFMMPPLAAEGVVTMMERVCAPGQVGGGVGGGGVGGWAVGKAWGGGAGWRSGVDERGGGAGWRSR